MKKRLYFIAVFCFIAVCSNAQHTITIDATLHPGSKSLTIRQQIDFKNTSQDILDEIFLNDWANSFSSKTTPLAKRFSEHYDSPFHFERNKNRGRTTMESVRSKNNAPLQWTHGDEIDILKVILDEPLQPGETYSLVLSYEVKLPSDRFTKF